MKNTKLLKALSIALAIMLLLPALSMVALAKAEGIREITKQPSAANPSIELSDNEEVTYQWYRLELDPTEITSDDVVYEFDGEVINSTYGENGWEADPSLYPGIYFAIYLEAGTKILIPESGIEFNMYGEGGAIAEHSINNGYNVYEIAESDNYLLQSEHSEATTRVYFCEYKEVLLEDQTSPTLTEFEIGNDYYVEATYKDGQKLISKSFTMEYSIKTHPKFSSPLVETNSEENVIKYEWYYVKAENKEYPLAPKNSTEIEGIVYEGIYNNGKWQNESGYINIAVDGFVGDKLQIKVPDSFGGVARIYQGDDLERDENLIYYHVISGDYSFVDFEIIEENGISLQDVEIWIERDGKKINVVPKSYFDEESQEVEALSASGGTYKDGKWVIDGEFGLSLRTNSQGILKVASSAEIAVYASTASGYFLLDETGEATVNNSIHIVVYCNEPGAELEITFIKDEKSYNVVSRITRYLEEAGIRLPDYVNDGIYGENGWEPNGEDHEIDIELDLVKGEIVTVVPSKEFDGDVVIYVEDGGTFKLEGDNGKYIYVAPERVYVDVELENCEKDFTASITMQRGTVSLLEDQKEKTLDINDIGIYYAVVEMNDRSILISNPFLTEQAVKFDTNGGTPIDLIITSELTEIESTKRQGFVLEGWYLDKELTNKATLPMEVKGAVTLFAKWELCNHKESTSVPSCTKSATCSLCEKELLASGHIWQAEYEKTANGHANKCQVCGEANEVKAHTYTEWTESKAPTTKEAGSKIRACTECGYTEAQDVDMLESTLSNGAIIGIIIGSSAFLALLAIGLCYIIFKKKSL